MENTILIVDDSKPNRTVLNDLLKDDYEIVEAENGKDALTIIDSYKDDIAAVMLDLNMPVMSGMDFLKAANEMGYMDSFPVLIVTGEEDFDQIGDCFDYGASDFIRKPVEHEFVKKRVKRLVDLYAEKKHLRIQSNKQNSTLQAQFRILQEQTKKLKESNRDIIRILGTIVEYRKLENGARNERIASFTKILGVQIMQDCPEYELTPEKIRILSAVSALYDIGKILIPDSILFKPGKLTSDEFEYMKSHTIRGYDIIEQLAGSWDPDYIQFGKEIARWHHEKFDGRGYPDGLVGDNIPISAQIVSLADCYDALINDSAYRKAYPLDTAFNMIQNGECGVFSPKLLTAFSKARPFMESVVQKPVE